MLSARKSLFGLSSRSKKKPENRNQEHHAETKEEDAEKEVRTDNTLRVPTLDLKKEAEQLRKITSIRAEQEEEEAAAAVNKGNFLEVDSAVASAASGGSSAVLSRDSGVSVQSQGSSLEGGTELQQQQKQQQQDGFVQVLPPPMDAEQEEEEEEEEEGGEDNPNLLGVPEQHLLDVFGDEFVAGGGDRSSSRSLSAEDEALMAQLLEGGGGLISGAAGATATAPIQEGLDEDDEIDGSVTPALAALEQHQLYHSGYTSRRRSLEVS